MSNRMLTQRYEIWHGTPCRHADVELDLLHFAGAPYARVYEATYQRMQGSPVEADLAYIWRKHNLDDRPAADEIRSLSTGDLVVLKAPERGVYVVDTYGFTKLSEYGVTLEDLPTLDGGRDALASHLEFKMSDRKALRTREED